MTIISTLNYWLVHSGIPVISATVRKCLQGITLFTLVNAEPIYNIFEFIDNTYVSLTNLHC